jgi:hypothetical protein
MDVIRHEHPRSEIIPSFSGPFPQNFYYDTGHFRFSQPPWSGRRRIQQSVSRDEGCTAGSPEVGYSSDG